MVKARKFIAIKRFEGWPKLSDFQLVEENLPALKNGEILVKAEILSVDPSYRFQFNYNTFKPVDIPHDQPGFQVGVVIESKNDRFPVGTRVISYKGWKDYYIGDPDAPVEIYTKDRIAKVPNLKGLPYSYAVGVVGMPGASAYLGLLRVTNPKPGDTVVVTGAAGAVGSVVGQIAKIKGCRVIGFAGTDEKVQWLEKEMGFDKAFNYKTVNVANALKEAAPNGVDIYFDNVGGEISSSIISQMNRFGRVSVCGGISTYNELELPKVPMLLPVILNKSLMVQGFSIYKFSAEDWDEAFNDLVNWVKDGKIKVTEHIVEGFEKAPEAFIGMLSGDNLGKAIVKV